jgi:hypothetical protein
MVTETLRPIPGPMGPLEARLDLPAGTPRAAMVLGHPHPLYGGTLQTKAVYYTARALTRIGVAVLRINFRGAGHSAGTFDEGRGEQDDYRAGLDFMADRFPDRPLWAGGLSFGSHVGMTVGATDPRVTLLLGIAVPVDRYAYDAVRDSGKPVFLIHGEEDGLVPVRLVRQFYGTLAEPRELVVIDGADHLFEGLDSVLADAVEGLLADFEVHS